MHICDFEGARRIGAPKDWDQALDGECGTIFVVDATDLLSGMNIMYSVYKPTDEEIEELKKGGVIRLGILGRSHPVFQLGVLSAEAAETAQLRPVWDLGPIIGVENNEAHS